MLARDDVGFVEILVEAHPPDGPLPHTLLEAKRQGIAIVPHGVGLSLGGADPPDLRRLDHLLRLAERVDAPLISEHVAFVRGGGIGAGHLLPVARRRDALEVLIENADATWRACPCPLRSSRSPRCSSGRTPS